MKHRAAFLLISVLAFAFVSAMLTGCEAFTFSADGLLVAPSIADEQAAIRQALYDSAGRSATLAYPRSGDYRSAYVITDLDGDESEEALVFYTISSSTEQNVRVAVLDKDEYGEWRAVYELAGGGTSIDTVMVTEYGEATDIVIGYGTALHDESVIDIYRYRGSKLDSIYEDWYTEAISADMDFCGNNELILIKKSGTSASVSVIKAKGGAEYLTVDRSLLSDVSSVSDWTAGELYDGIGALFIDVIDEDGYLMTEILYLDGDELLCLSALDSELLWKTERSAGYSSCDYDGDGVVEIPTLGLFSGYGAWSGAEYMVTWLSYSADEGLAAESYTYLNLSDSYIFKIPSRWLNFVSVIRDEDTGEITFVKYDSSKGSLSEMEKLLSITEVSAGSAEQYLAQGYEIIAQTDDRAYLYMTIADEDEPLLLTADEIADNLYIRQ